MLDVILADRIRDGLPSPVTPGQRSGVVIPMRRVVGTSLVCALAAVTAHGLGCARRGTQVGRTPAASSVEAEVPVTPGRSLGVGAEAPPVHVEHWLSGPAPSLAFEPGAVTVIEFVASSSAYGRALVPQMNALHRAFSGHGVQMVAVTAEPADQARSMLQATPDGDGGDVPEFPLGAALDPSTHAAYLDVVDREGLPTAFVVGKDGRVDWFGDPEILEEPLRRVVGDTWDRAAFAEQMARLQPLAAQVTDILTRFPFARRAALQSCRELVASHAGRADELNEIAWVLVDAAEGVSLESEPAVRKLLAVADTAVQESLRIDPDDGNTLDTLAHLQALRGDLAAALDTQRRAAANPGLFAPRIRRYLAELETRAATEGGPTE